MLIVGNWKLNDFQGEVAGLKQAVEAIEALSSSNVDIVICPPSILLAKYVEVFADRMLGFGTQDCSAHQNGAFTGEISAEMIKAEGAAYCIVGHSERRAHHGETDADISAKANQAIRAGLVPIICVGEADADQSNIARAQFLTEQTAQSTQGLVVGRFVIAYEPVWAIGSGKIPDSSDIKAAIDTIKGASSLTTPVLYGGSVNPSNAAEICSIAGLGGVLVGGASLKVETFLGIIKAAC